MTLEDIYPILGIKGDLPLIGYVFNEELAKSNKNLLERFLKATNESRKILETSDQEWLRLKKLTGARSDQMLITLLLNNSPHDVHAIDHDKHEHKHGEHPAYKTSILSIFILSFNVYGL